MLIETVAGSSQTKMPVNLIQVVGDTAIPGDGYISEYSSMAVPAFWRGVNFLANTIASFRRAVIQERPGSRVENVSHPLNTLLRLRISDVSTPLRTIQTWMHHAVVWGNGFLWVKRDRAGRPVALLNLNPEITTPFLWQGQKYIYVALEEPVVLDDADVLHIATIGFDGVRGYSTVQMMRTALEVSVSGATFTRDYLKRGTVLGGAIEFPGVLDDAQMATLRQGIREFNSESGQRRFELMILQAGGALKNSTIPNQTSQLIETRKLSDIVVCQILGISPHIVYQLDSQKLANVQQMGAEVVKYSLTPWLTQIEEEFNAKLFSPAEQLDGLLAKLDPNSLLRGDEGALSAQMGVEVNGGLRTVNEARAVIGLPPVGPEGDKLRVPVNFPTTPGQPTTPDAIGPAAPPVGDAGTAPAEPAPPAEKDDTTDGDDPNTDPGSYSRAGAVLAPLVDAMAARVEAKTTKAFANRSGKPAAELTPWANLFADEQARYIDAELGPILAAARAMGADPAYGRVAQRYADAVKLRAATGAAPTLAAIIDEATHEQQ